MNALQFQATDGLQINMQVWVPHHGTGYTLGHIQSFTNDQVTVRIDETRQVISAGKKYVHRLEEDLQKDTDDNCSLLYLNEGNLLKNLKLRYGKDKIYTYLANMLIVVNPCVNLPELHNDELISSYKDKSLGLMPPHIYAIADKAHREMESWNQNQSIILCGESGSGKTESTNMMIEYFIMNWGEDAGHAEERLLECKKILQAFGNAKTSRNYNASRFGKFFELHFNGMDKICGGKLTHYLLDKSRVCVQNADERNYHIFYYLLIGADQHLRCKLQLEEAKNYEFLKHGCIKVFDLETMHQNFHDVDLCLFHMHFTQPERTSIYTILAAILHLGNVKFVENNKNPIDPASSSVLSFGAEMIGVCSIKLTDALSTISINSVRKSSTASEARKARDALCKYLYSKLFDYIIQRINIAISSPDSANFIGILDIAGFEFFSDNRFEQFCINYCSEIFQQHFIDHVLKAEQENYIEEGLHFQKTHFEDNSDVLLLQVGILDILDEAVKTRSHSKQFCMKVVDHYSEFPGTLNQSRHPRFNLASNTTDIDQKSRRIENEEGFMVYHYVGEVVYKTEQFVENNDRDLQMSLKALILESPFPLLKEMLKDEVLIFEDVIPIHETVGGHFRKQIMALMHKLHSSDCSFVRCIKPNPELKPQRFHGEYILKQVRSSGLSSLLELMNTGYPTQISFSFLYEKFKDVIPPKMDLNTFLKLLFKACDFADDDYAFGKTKVFFRPGNMGKIDKMLRMEGDKFNEIVDKVHYLSNRSLWWKVQFAVVSCSRMMGIIRDRARSHILLQSLIRTILARRVFVPRMEVLQQLEGLCNDIDNETGPLVHQLVTNREKAILQINVLKNQVQDNMDEMKGVLRTLHDENAMAALYEQFNGERNTILEQLQNYMNEETVELQVKIAEDEWLRKQEQLKNIKDKEKDVAEQLMLEEQALENRLHMEKLSLELDLDLDDTLAEEHFEMEKDEKYASHIPISNYGPINALDIKHAASSTRENSTLSQRYFLVPFIHSQDANNYYKPTSDQHQKGYWLGHFNNGKIVRQLELHNGRNPVAMVGGKDHADMCTVPLQQSGLLDIERSEISQEKFEQFWNRFKQQSSLFSNQDLETSLFLKLWLHG